MASISTSRKDNEKSNYRTSDYKEHSISFSKKGLENSFDSSNMKVIRSKANVTMNQPIKHINA